MISSRALTDLDPRVQKLAEVFIAACASGPDKADIIVTSTYRDNDAQDWLYSQGRSRPGAIVTNAKGGQSFHNYRLAFDFAPLVNGKIPWNDSAIFTRLGMIGEGLGLEWAGRWTGSLRELAHMQWTGGLTLADLQNGKRPTSA